MYTGQTKYSLTKQKSHTKSGCPFFQSKLTINKPGDPYEQEADAVADQLLRTQTPSNQKKAGEDLFFKPASPSINSVQPKCAGCEEEEEKKMQRKETSGAETDTTSSFENYVGGLNSSGRPLSKEARDFFEPKLGHDFGDVKVHTDSVAAESAHSIQALAYTSGNNIVFNSNQYAPQSENGKRLLGHELIHVIQQKGNISAKRIQRQPDFLRNLDPSCTVDWQAVWENRFEAGRDVSCGAQTPLGRVNTSDIYAAYQYLFGNRPPGTTTITNPCPADRRIIFGGCCPENTYYDTANLRCAEYSIDLRTLPCPANWIRSTLGICEPPIITPSTQFTLPTFEFPTLPRPRSFGSISSMTIDHFAFDGSTVPAGHEAELDHLVALLNIYREAQVHVDGYADSTGEPGYNTGLSQRRAEAVKTELVNRGIDPARIIITPYGESSRVVAPETSEEDRARNRRVDIWYFVAPATNPFGLTLTPPTP